MVGDGFVAGLLTGRLENVEARESASELEDVLRLANAVGALTITPPGVIPALPIGAKVLKLLKDSA